MKKSFKKSLSILLSAAMVFTGANYEPVSVNAASVSSKFAVKSYADLKKVQTELNNFIKKNEDNLDNCTFTIDIQKDIVASDTEWVGIDLSRKNPSETDEEIKTYNFNLVLNGNGHTISKLSNKSFENKDDRDVYYSGISGTTFSPAGLGIFGEVLGKLSVSNLTISDCDLKTRVSNSNNSELHDRVQTDWNAGVIVGSVRGSLNLSDIYIKNSVTEGLSSSAVAVGSYVSHGANDIATFKNIKITNSKVYGPSHTGALIGTFGASAAKVRGKVDNCTTDAKTLVDGSATIASKLSAEKKIFTTSSKTGQISGSGEGFAGIRVGGLFGTANNVDIINCTNAADVKANKPNSAFVGGIVGLAWENVTIKNCTNTGDVIGYDCVGGIAGYLSSGCKIEDSKNSGNITASHGNVGGVAGIINNKAEASGVTNTGKIHGETYVGGIAGSNYGKLTDAVNKGEVIGVDVVGGNLGYNGNAGECANLTNEGPVTGQDNVGGNIGINDGIATNLSNGGKVDGRDNVGGNIGKNTNRGTADTLSNEGDVTGRDNVGGNVGDNQGKVTNAINSGKVKGDENVGGNVGNNERTGSVSGATNAGDVSGNKNVDENIGKNDGNSSGLNKLPKTDDGVMVVGPEDPKYPDLPDFQTSLFGMKIRVITRGEGAVIFEGIKNGEIKLSASPKYGYKLKGWKCEGTTPASSTKIVESFKIKKGALIECHFDKAKTGDTLVPVLGKDDPTPANNINKVTFCDGLTLGVTPAKAGRIDLVSSDDAKLAITAVPQVNAKFIEWRISGKVAFAKGSTKNSQTATFTYKKGDKASIIAVFQFGKIAPVGKKLKDRKYYYRVTKSGSVDGSLIGEIQVIGIRKKSLKQIKIARQGVFDGITYRVTSIGANAFKGNKKVTTAHVSKYIKSIGSGAFANMKKLKKVTISSKVLTKIGKNAFAKDKKLKLVVIKSKKLKKIGKKAFNTGKKITIKVPKAKKAKYCKLLKKAKCKKFVVK